MLAVGDSEEQIQHLPDQVNQDTNSLEHQSLYLLLVLQAEMQEYSLYTSLAHKLMTANHLQLLNCVRIYHDLMMQGI